jgi:hypothetical protein
MGEKASGPAIPNLNNGGMEHFVQTLATAVGQQLRQATETRASKNIPGKKAKPGPKSTKSKEFWKEQECMSEEVYQAYVVREFTCNTPCATEPSLNRRASIRS